MTAKEKAVRNFAKAMRDANISYIADQGRFTPSMDNLWWLYVYECQEEIKNAKTK